MKIVYILIIAFLLDCLLGDPHYQLHPACLIGNLISLLSRFLRKRLTKDKEGELAGGVLLVCLVVLISVGVSSLLILAVSRFNTIAGIALQCVFCYQLLAGRSLCDESMKVCHALYKGDVEAARKAVSMIVGRDTSVLDEAGIARAAVETVAENTSDGVIAPMIFMAIGGAPLGFFYKAVNTMDSMVGYKDGGYLYFGRAAAKLDDVLNYIPARVSGILMIMAAALTGQDAKGAWRIFKRDRYKHASPNSAQTESACAGALELRLAGDAWYFGELHKKEYIGDPIKEIEPVDIRRANRLMYGTSFLCLALCVGIRFCIVRLIG